MTGKIERGIPTAAAIGTEIEIVIGLESTEVTETATGTSTRATTTQTRGGMKAEIEEKEVVAETVTPIRSSVEAITTNATEDLQARSVHRRAIMRIITAVGEVVPDSEATVNESGIEAATLLQGGERTEMRCMPCGK